MKTKQRQSILLVSLLTCANQLSSQETPDIVDYRDGQITWTNVNPALFYSVQWLSGLTAPQWTSSFRGLQDLQSTEPYLTAELPMFFRIVGSSNALHTFGLSPDSTEVAEGYYTATNLAHVDPDLTPGNVTQGVSLFGVPGAAVVATGDASEAQVLSGSSFSVAGQSGLVGKMPNLGGVTIVPGTAALSVAQGYHDGTGTVAGEANLLAENIRGGVAIFGVTGKPEVVDTSSGDAVAADVVEGRTAWVDGAEVVGERTPAPVPKTGQTNTFRPGDDGDVEAGVDWPNPRFTVMSDAGVVRDNLTGLMWTSEANIDGPKDWPSAVDFCQALDHGGFTDWRLPNIRELQSLIDFGRFEPALPAGHPFTGWQSDNYWSSTMLADPSGDAWYLRLMDGYIDVSGTTAQHYVWPVRGGQ